jgi:hypothetical protein
MSETIKQDGFTYRIVPTRHDDVFMSEKHDNDDDFVTIRLPKDVAIKFAKAILKEYGESNE